MTIDMSESSGAVFCECWCFWLSRSVSDAGVDAGTYSFYLVAVIIQIRWRCDSFIWAWDSCMRAMRVVSRIMMTGRADGME